MLRTDAQKKAYPETFRTLRCALEEMHEEITGSVQMLADIRECIKEESPLNPMLIRVEKRLLVLLKM